jgi:hypothetical protein
MFSQALDGRAHRLLCDRIAIDRAPLRRQQRTAEEISDLKFKIRKRRRLEQQQVQMQIPHP